MILDRVTITGADDSIDPVDLVKLSTEFPFVEWGILFGRQQGKGRFPSIGWIEKLEACHTPDMKLSAHLCSHWVRDIVLGVNFSWLQHPAFPCYIFQRVQLNFHGQYHKRGEGLETLLHEMSESWQFIFQCDGVNDGTIGYLVESRLCVPLFDTSGGAGKVPGKWPEVWTGAYCGYAGGLGPHNVVSELHRIKEVAGDERIWIDMERNVRSEDDSLFDLDKVRDVLVQCQPLLKGS